jgi:hypothetical protein
MMPAVLRPYSAGTGDELHLLRQPRIERLAEDAEAFGQDHAVKPVLQIVVLAADVKLSERILRCAWRLQDDLAEGAVRPTRLALYGRRIDDVGRGAGAGLNAVARVREPLRGDEDLIGVVSKGGV